MRFSGGLGWLVNGHGCGFHRIWSLSTEMDGFNGFVERTTSDVGLRLYRNSMDSWKWILRMVDLKRGKLTDIGFQVTPLDFYWILDALRCGGFLDIGRLSESINF